MTQASESLEDQLRRVLDQAASQLPIRAADPGLVASPTARVDRQARRDLRRPRFPSVGGAITAIAVLVAVGIGVAAIALLSHRHRPATSASRRDHGQGIAGPNAALLRRVRGQREADPTILTTGNVNNRPGVELFIREAALSSGRTVGVYTFDGKSLRHAGDFVYGGDSAIVQGFSCA